MASSDEARWRARLQRVVTVGELTRVVQAFLASWKKSDFEILARVCAPVTSGSSADIKETVVRLASARVTIGVQSEAHQHVKRMFFFYTEAASRLGHIEFASLAASGKTGARTA